MHTEALFHVRPFRGATKPHLMMCEGEELYLVKFAWNPLGTEALISDYIVSRLAQLVGLAVPQCRIVRVSPYLIRSTDELFAELSRNADCRETEFHFGSSFIGPPHYRCVRPSPPFDSFDGVSRAANFPGALALDVFCQSSSPRQALFFRAPSLNGCSVAFIDFSRALSGILRGQVPGVTAGLSAHVAAYHMVTGFESFEPYLSRIASLKPEAIEQICEDVPSCWHPEKPHLVDLIAESLIARRGKLFGLVAKTCESAPKLFPCWSFKPRVQYRTPERAIGLSGHLEQFG